MKWHTSRMIDFWGKINNSIVGEMGLFLKVGLRFELSVEWSRDFASPALYLDSLLHKEKGVWAGN